MFRRVANWISLFGSASTLLCCALPAVFVSLGAGATFAALVTRFPQLVWVSEHKTLVFVLAGVSLVLAGVLQWNARNLPCPVDPELARACDRSRRWSKAIYWSSVGIYGIGAFFAFAAPYLFI